MTYAGVFVDDQDAVFAEQLSTPGVLDIEHQDVLEVTSLARLIAAKQPMLVALDYRLDETPAGLKPDQTYKGSALAQHLRDASIETPATDFALVLVSAETKIRTLYKPDKTAHDLFDRVYVKEDINKNRAQIRRELLSLCAAYAALRQCGGVYKLADIMRAEGDDQAVIDVQALTLRLEDAKAPHLVVKTLLTQLIERPGPLIDTADACAHLGVSNTDADRVAALLTEHGADYHGLLHEAWPRWWTHRVEALAQETFGRRATGLPASDRARVLSEKFGSAFEPAVSPWTQSPHELVALACSCCRRGVELKHTVAVFESYLPRFATRRRVCWDCVQTDKYREIVPPIVIDEVDQDLAEAVKALQRPDGDAA